MSAKIEEDLGVPFMRGKRYDLIIANHVPVIERLYKRGPIVQVCHGVFPPLEQPSPYADFHIAISQEVERHLRSKGVKKCVTLLNGLDLLQKCIERPVGNKIESVLSLCQSETANKILGEICQDENWKFTAFNKHVNPTMNIEGEINQHDIVVGIGRSVFDAMACGRPCIVYDHRDYNGNMGDGYLVPVMFDKFVLNNCSGRYSGLQFDKESLRKEFEKYNARDSFLLRQIAEDKLDMNKVVSALISIAEQYQLTKKSFQFKKLFFRLLTKKYVRKLNGMKR
jgi:hypothetical protein